MTDDQPDFTADQLYEIATLPQRETVDKVRQFGWVVSHLWKRDEGDIVVWLIAKTPGAKGYTHGFINPDGTLGRYQPKMRIKGREANHQDD
jgi:hypothetical protein